MRPTNEEQGKLSGTAHPLITRTIDPDCAKMLLEVFERVRDELVERLHDALRSDSCPRPSSLISDWVSHHSSTTERRQGRSA